MMKTHKTELDVAIDWSLEFPIVSEKDAGFSCL
jgi:dTDP-4-dehydrorhamnose 3,5-epimerase-like enzyme